MSKRKTNRLRRKIKARKGATAIRNLLAKDLVSVARLEKELKKIKENPNKYAPELVSAIEKEIDNYQERIKEDN